MRRALLVSICVIFFLQSFAQYSDLGTGALKNQIWWFDWAGFNFSNGGSKTFTTADGLSVTISFSKVSGEIPFPEVMNTWSGAVLHFLYDFSNPSIKPAIFKRETTGNSFFTLNVVATRNGVPTPFTFIAADAEASDNRELIRLKTSGTNWQTIDFFKNSSQTTNPLQGCGTQNAVITETYGFSAGVGQNPVLSTNTIGTQPLVIDVSFERTTFGGTAAAFGIFAPIDRGDLPPSYGSVQHLLSFATTNACNYGPPYPTLLQSETLKLGSMAGDSDGMESLDDNSNGVDEDALSSFSTYDGSGEYRLTIPLVNTTGSNAFLSGWFDYNRDGTFNPNEAISTTVANGASSAVLQWSGLPQNLPKGPNNKYAFRFRLSSNQIAIQNPTGSAQDGEVEDYLISFPECTLNVQTINNTDICEGNAVRLTSSGATTYSWHPAASLSDATISNPIATPVITTEYIVTGSDNLGCIGKDTVVVTVKQKPVITKTSDVSLCQGDTIQLNASSPTAQSYAWTPATGINNPSDKNPLASPQTTTKYLLKVTDNKGCENIDSITITVLAKPDVAIRPDTTVCKGSSILLTSQTQNATLYEWLPQTGLSDPSIASPAALVSANVQYILKAIGSNNCFIRDTIRITTLQLPTINKSADTTICQNEVANLTASGGVNYLWIPQTNLSNPTNASTIARPTTSTRYYVTVTDNNGCTSKDSVNITVHSLPVFQTLPAAPFVCAERPVDLIASGGSIYSWLSEDNVEFSNSPVITVRPLQNTTYKVSIADAVCDVRDTLLVPVVVNKALRTNVTKSTDIDCSHHEARLLASGGVKYVWEKAEEISNLNIANPTVSASKTTTYYVNVSDQYGCTNRDSITVNVDFTLALSLHLMPSAFTPNNDGKNDCFGLKYWGPVSELSFAVYNRWGQKVFYTSNSAECWDGTVKGKPEPSALFVYIIKAKSICGDVEKKGTIMLIR